jgi:hypothetical protein
MAVHYGASRGSIQAQTHDAGQYGVRKLGEGAS